MKRIKESKVLYKVPIDEHNVIEDAVLDLLFDDSRYLQEKNEAVGFICDYPIYTRTIENSVEISIYKISALCPAIINTIVERITGNEYENIFPELKSDGHIHYFDEDSKLAAVFSLDSDILRLEYYLAE